MNIPNRKNMLKTIRFEKPDFIPMFFHINAACWHHYDQEALKDLMEEHKLLFPDYKRSEGKVIPHYGLDQRKNAPYTDYWGCVWETSDNGITGSVHKHPLESWDNFENYKAPDPEENNGMFPSDWEKLKTGITEAKKNNVFTMGGLPHGHTFLRLQDIRGYVNLIMDMADEKPDLVKLIDMVSDFNYELICKWIEIEPDMLDFPEDLGMQVGPMLSPDHFRKYIKPVYQRVMKPARERGIIVHMHSDGDIRDLADDLIDGGVEVINLQDLVNGIDWIQKKFAGKTCINLDIDRQKITPYGSPEEIDALVREEVEKLGSKEGGLIMVYGMYPGVPLENAKTLMNAMEKYMGYWG